LRWYFFMLTQFFMVKRMIGATQLDGLVLDFGQTMQKITGLKTNWPYRILVQHHEFTTYIGFVGGIMVFVMTLR